MNYKFTSSLEDGDDFFDMPTDFQSTKIDYESNTYEIDMAFLDNLFNSIEIQYLGGKSNELIDSFNQLNRVYSGGKINLSNFYGKYNFILVCNEIIINCPSTSVLYSFLDCVNHGIMSDSDLCSKLSTPTFSEQLIFCIDLNGSSIYTVGFDVLSKVIQGYTDPLFSKLCYIYNSTLFETGDPTIEDVEKLNSFGKIFLRISEFVPECVCPVMIIIAKSFLLRGMFNYGISVLNNIVDHYDKMKIQIYVLTELNSSHLRRIGELNESFDPISDIDNDFVRSISGIPSTTFLLLVKLIPFINSQSEIYGFNFEDTLIETLSLINKLTDKWIGFYHSSLNSINCEYLYELINDDENFKIQSLSLLLVSNILRSENYLAVMTKPIMETFIRKITNAPMKIKENILYGFIWGASEFTQPQIDELVDWGLFEILIDFFASDSEKLTSEIANSLRIMANKSEKAKDEAYNYLEEFEQLFQETQSVKLKSRIYLLNLILKNDNSYY